MTASLSFIGTKPASSSYTVNLQSALAPLEVSPRYLRALADQIHIWSFTEIMALLFTHLMMLITKYMHNGASSISVMQDIAGLLLLVSMECAFEVMLLLVLVRQNNLPMLSSAYEKGVLRCSFLVQACIAIAYISNSHPYTWVLMLRTTDPDKWGDTTPLDICPNHSNVFVF